MYQTRGDVRFLPASSYFWENALSHVAYQSLNSRSASRRTANVLSSTGPSIGCKWLLIRSRMPINSTVDTSRMSSSINKGCCKSIRQPQIPSSSFKIAGRPDPKDILNKLFRLFLISEPTKLTDVRRDTSRTRSVKQSPARGLWKSWMLFQLSFVSEVQATLCA